MPPGVGRGWAYARRAELPDLVASFMLVLQACALRGEYVRRLSELGKR
jgi:hypothetical protein